MRERIKTRRGLDLRLAGALPAEALATAVAVRPQQIAICPDDFPGFVPKPEVAVGDEVAAGQALLRHKDHPLMKLSSPCCGRVAEIVRGERRRIERVVVDVAPADDSAEEFGGDSSLSDIDLLQRSGLLAMIRRRPYDTVALPDDRPRDIYVTGLDSAPLALDPVAALQHAQPAQWRHELAAGTALLRRITTGNVYIACRPGELDDIDGAVMLDVEGPHPAGLAGTLIAATRPVDKGHVVWTMPLWVLADIGCLALTGRVPGSATVAVTGPSARAPRVVDTLRGAALRPLLEDELPGEEAGHVRVVSGNVLTGIKQSAADGWLRYPYTQLTLLAEGDDRDSFMGWASMSPKRHSVSRSFLSWLMPGRLYSPDARLNGGRRAMIMSGVWDRVMPLDLMPEPLVKAMIAGDVERMERLGVYEVAPEDFALAEYVDPSKTRLQQIVRQGLDTMRRELA